MPNAATTTAPIDIDQATDFFEFVTERHNIWLKRQVGEPQPWTENPILAEKKFTNVFRILDHDSQWVMENLIREEDDAASVLLRLFLFRHTGRVAAWEYSHALAGDIYSARDLDEIESLWLEYRNSQPKVSRTRDGEEKVTWVPEREVFTSAYLVFPQSQTPGTDKIVSIIDLARRLFTPGSSQYVVDDFLRVRTQQERFHVFHRNPGVGDFMSMQVLTDWGYTPHCGEDRENDFIVAGPGSARGAKIVAPGMKAEETIRWAQEAIISEGSVKLLGRYPSLMDVQNCFCEFSKYHRWATAGNLKGVGYTPAHPGPQPKPVLPHHWNIK